MENLTNKPLPIITSIMPDVLPEKVKRLIEASVASETKRAYASRLQKFFTWCNKENISPIFPSTSVNVAAYLSDLFESGVSESYVTQTCAAITSAHKAMGYPSPTGDLIVKKVLKGFKRLSTRKVKPKEAATVDIIIQILKQITATDAKSVRDKALIALGFSGAFRRSELVALDIEDIKWIKRDFKKVALITVNRSKTDQERQGMTKAIFESNDIDTSPVILLQEWIQLLNCNSGPLFRSLKRNGQPSDNRLTPQSVRLILQERSKNAGITMDISAHSLRSGFVTTAIRQGANERSIMNQTGHKSTKVLRGYFQREDAIEDNAAKNILQL